MEKRPANVPRIILSIFGLITLILIISFFYLSLNGRDYSDIYLDYAAKFGLASDTDDQNEGRTININTSEGEKRIIIKTEIENITNKDIEKELVRHMAILLKLYNLHNIPYTTITPKIQVYLENKPYFIEILDGDIILDDGIAKEPDISIRTTHNEIFKMIEDEGYSKESIDSEKTHIDILASDFVLFSKGYLSLYNELGRQFTGYSIIKN